MCPHVIESWAMTVPPDNPSLPAFNAVTLRSMADGTERRVPAAALVPIGRYFEQRCREHLCASEPRCGPCKTLLGVVHAECAKRTPPMTFAARWRELAPELAMPAGCDE